MTRIAAVALLAIAWLGAGCLRTSSGSPLDPTAPGTPIGAPATRSVGQAGGSLASPDGRLTLTVPEGALAEPVELSIQPVTVTAPGGVVGSWRLGPEGVTFRLPVTLAIRASSAGPLESLTVATQDALGYWLHAPGVSRDARAGALVVQPAHFSDWTVVAAPGALDLTGPFTLTSTQPHLASPVAVAGPTTFLGQATLSWAGVGDGTARYLVSGTVTVPDPLAVGATSCSVGGGETNALPLHVSVAEVPGVSPALRWGLSGYWHLACADGSREFVDLLFDTAGVDYLGCTRSAIGPQLLGTSELAGDVLVDCGAAGTIEGRWDFRAGTCGNPCAPPAAPCHQGSYDCTLGACVDSGLDAPAGTACGGGLVCDGAGSCGACADGGSCPASSGCATGTLACGATPTCVEGPPLALKGTACGTADIPAVCDGAGACTRCTAGLACTPALRCHLGTSSCASGGSTCADTGTVDPSAEGLPCGPGAFCVAGACLVRP